MRQRLQSPFTILGQHLMAVDALTGFGELSALWKDVGMFRLITICAALILGCVLVAGYLADGNVTQSIVDAVPTKTTHVLSTKSANDGEIKVETAEEPDQDSGETADGTDEDASENADTADSSDDDDSGSGGDVANASPADDDDSGGAQTKPDEWNPGELPGDPGK